jgi:hypothetical protein
MKWRSRGTLAGLDVSIQEARSRAVVAAGYRPAVVAQVCVVGMPRAVRAGRCVAVHVTDYSAEPALCAQRQEST